MALDPQIALGVRPPVLQPLQIQSPLERYGKVLTLRGMMQNQQLGQMNVEQTRLENEALRRTAQDEQTLGSWMQQNQRPDLTASEIVAAHPNPTGLKVATAWSAQQTAALTQRKAVLDAAHEEAKTDDRIYNSVTDDQSKLAALTELVRLKRIDGTQASHLAAIPFDSPEFKGIQQRVAAGSMDRVQRIEAAKKEIELRIAQATEGSTTKGAIAEGDKKTLDAANTQKASDAAMVAAAFDVSPQAGAAVLATLSKDPRRAEPFANVTNAAQARQVGLTAEQQAVGERAKTTAEQQLWGAPGGLISIINDPKRTPEDKQRAGRALDLHKELDAIKAAAAANVLYTPTKEAQITRIEEAKREGKPATAEERKVLNFYDRMVDAAKTIETPGVDAKGNRIPSLEEQVQQLGRLEQTRLRYAWNDLQTPEGQVYNQALKQFTEARLRKESGAVIGPAELEESRRTFFPEPGDKPPVLERKRKAREGLIKSMQEEAGQAYKQRAGGQEKRRYNPATGLVEVIR